MVSKKNKIKRSRLLRYLELVVIFILFVTIISTAILNILVFAKWSPYIETIPDLFIYIMSSERLNVKEGFLSLPNYGIDNNGGVCWFTTFFVFEFNTHHSRYLVASLRYYKYLLSLKITNDGLKNQTKDISVLSKVKIVFKDLNAIKFISGMNTVLDFYYENKGKNSNVSKAQKKEVGAIYNEFISPFFESENVRNGMLASGSNFYSFFNSFIEELKHTVKLDISKFWELMSKDKSDHTTSIRIRTPSNTISLKSLTKHEGGCIYLNKEYLQGLPTPFSFKEVLEKYIKVVGENIMFELNVQRELDFTTRNIKNAYIKNILSDFIDGKSSFIWEGRRFRETTLLFLTSDHIFSYLKGTTGKFVLLDSYISERDCIYLDVENIRSIIKKYNWEEISAIYFIFEEF